jgi:hypothetical protein
VENSCKKCDAIFREYRIAYLDFRDRASQETRDACKALGELIGGLEADMQRVEDRLPRLRPMTAQQLNIATLKAGMGYLGGEDRVRDAMLKKWLRQKAPATSCTFRSVVSKCSGLSLNLRGQVSKTPNGSGVHFCEEQNPTLQRTRWGGVCHRTLATL